MQDQLEQGRRPRWRHGPGEGHGRRRPVEATLTGTGELVGLVIKPEACDPTDTESLADLIVAAVRDANHQAMALAQATMPQLPELDL